MEEQLSLISPNVHNSRRAIAEGMYTLTGKSCIANSLFSYQHYLIITGRSELTVEGFTCDIRDFADVFPKRELSKLTTPDLRDYISLYKGQGNKAKSCLRKVNALKNYFRWLVRDKVLDYDPSVLLECKREVSPLPELLNKDEVCRFVKASRESPVEHVLTLLLIGAGLKRKEIKSLREQNIDISNPLQPRVRIDSNTNHGRRCLDLPLEFVKAYKDHVKTCQPGDKVFNKTERELHNILNRIARRAKMSGRLVSCQTLRDTFAVQCLSAGELMDDVLRKLGHASVTTNKEARYRYTRLWERYG